MIARNVLEVRAPEPLVATRRMGDFSAERSRATPMDGAAPVAPRGPCIWISATCSAPLELVGRSVRELLSARLVSSELVCAASREHPGEPADAPADREVIERLTEAATDLMRGDRTVIVTGPLLDSEGAHAVRERVGRLVRVSLHPAVVDGGPPPIPTIYRFLQGPHLVEAAIPPRAVESTDRADIVVGGALRQPDQLAGEIVDALSRTGWLTALLPRPSGSPRPTVGVDPRDPATPGPWLAVRASR